jgi:hypothetical protein
VTNRSLGPRITTWLCRENVYIATYSEVDVRLANDVVTQGLRRRRERQLRPTACLTNPGSCRGVKLRENWAPKASAVINKKRKIWGHVLSGGKATKLPLTEVVLRSTSGTGRWLAKGLMAMMWGSASCSHLDAEVVLTGCSEDAEKLARTREEL